METVDIFDLDAELRIWISSEYTPTVSKKFNKSINIYEVQKHLAGKARSVKVKTLFRSFHNKPLNICETSRKYSIALSRFDQHF